MNAVWSAFTALPLVLPLVGALALWLLPSGSLLMRFRRRAAALILALTVLLLGADLITGASISFPFWQPLFAAGGRLAFAADPLGGGLGLLCTLTVALVCAAAIARPLERFEAVGMMWVASSATAIALAANLLTLCLAWVMMDLGLLFVDTVRAPEEGIARAVRNAFGGLLSSAALVAGTAAALPQDIGGSPLAALTPDGLPLKLLMLAALLRLGVYPLPGSLKRNWLAYLAAVCTGSYLWLRVATLAPAALPWAGWLLPLGTAALLASGALALLAPDFATALPAMLLNGLTLVVLAPLVDRTFGVGVALAGAANLALSLAVLRADGQVRPFGPLGRWARAPLALAVGSLVGWPGTLGFTAHWLFLRLCWIGGQRGLLLVASVSMMLAAAPAWSRLQQVLREVLHPDAPSRSMAWIAFGAAALGAALLVILGLTPTLFGFIWPDTPGLVRPTLLTMFSADLVQFAALLLTAVIVPAVGSHALQGLWDTISYRYGRLADALSGLLELDWLHAGLELVLSRLAAIATRTMAAVEESLYLGWALLWVLVVGLYLVGR